MPFGKYKDMDDCISKNKDKDSPGGYCAQIHKNITDKWPTEEKLKKEAKKKKPPRDWWHKMVANVKKWYKFKPDIVNKVVGHIWWHMRPSLRLGNKIPEKGIVDAILARTKWFKKAYGESKINKLNKLYEKVMKEAKIETDVNEKGKVGDSKINLEEKNVYWVECPKCKGRFSTKLWEKGSLSDGSCPKCGFTGEFNDFKVVRKMEKVNKLYEKNCRDESVLKEGKNPYTDKPGWETKFVKYKGYDIELVPTKHEWQAWIRKGGKTFEDVTGRDEKEALRNAKSMIDIGVESIKMNRLNRLYERVLKEQETIMKIDKRDLERVLQGKPHKLVTPIGTIILKLK